MSSRQSLNDGVESTNFNFPKFVWIFNWTIIDVNRDCVSTNALTIHTIQKQLFFLISFLLFRVRFSCATIPRVSSSVPLQSETENVLRKTKKVSKKNLRRKICGMEKAEERKKKSQHTQQTQCDAVHGTLATMDDTRFFLMTFLLLNFPHLENTSEQKLLYFYTRLHTRKHLADACHWIVCGIVAQKISLPSFSINSKPRLKIWWSTQSFVIVYIVKSPTIISHSCVTSIKT